MCVIFRPFTFFVNLLYKADDGPVRPKRGGLLLRNKHIDVFDNILLIN